MLEIDLHDLKKNDKQIVTDSPFVSAASSALDVT